MNKKDLTEACVLAYDENSKQIARWENIRNLRDTLNTTFSVSNLGK